MYRPRLAGPVPQAEDVVAVASRRLTDIDVTDERSLTAAVRDAVADAQPVTALSALTAAPRYGRRVTDAAMSWLQVVVLSVVQGLTEFLPVSSSGHLAIVSQRVLRRRRGRVVHRGQPARHRAGGADLLRPRHRAHPEGLVRRTVRHGAPHARLLDGLVGDHRHHPDRRRRPALQGLHPHRRPQSLGHRDRAVVFSAVIAAAEYFGRQTRHVEQFTWKDSIVIGAGAVPGAGARGVAVGRDHQRGPVPRAQTRELAARFGFLLAIPAVFASGLFSLPDAFHPAGEGMSATGPQLLVAHRHRVRRRLRRRGVVPAVPGAPQHVLVRRLPGGRSAWWC